jgi:hypothetical protein
MPIDLFNRAKNAWNAFINNKDPTKKAKEYGAGTETYYRPDRARPSRGAERSIVNSVYNRISVDVASVDIRHVRLDENDRYLETIESDLNDCLSLSANIDQTGRSFIQDAVMSMLDEGCIAVVPIDTDTDPDETGSIQIYSMRTAKIIAWKPNSVRVRVYNDRTGQYGELDYLKANVLILENPFYSIMNEPNSTMQRLIRKLSLLDTVDEQSSAGKLDLIIQLPYTVRSELRKQQADERKKAIEQQLAGSKYGIAYIDSTEHITQLNRAVENNLMSQIEYLTNMVYSQLGITAEILNGTADEKTMLNYNNRIIEPILSTIIGEMKRKWLSKTARTQKQSFMFFRDPFKLVPISNIAEIADKFTRNEIMTSNEVRQIVGMKKSDDPGADELRNKNLNQSIAETEEQMIPELQNEMQDVSAGDLDAAQNDFDGAMAEMDEFDRKLSEMEKDLNGTVQHSALYGIAESEDFDDWLQHYASPYYDPVKAHEYYMKHRELVGRNSTSGLNKEGQDMAAHIKKNIDSELQSKIASSKSRMETDVNSSTDRKNAIVSRASDKMAKDIERFRNQTALAREAHSKAMNSRIESLQKEISGGGKTDAQKKSIQEKIAKLREENSKKRDELTQNFNNLSNKAKADNASTAGNARAKSAEEVSKSKSQHSENVAKLKEEYSTKFGDEINKLKDAGYAKEEKSKSSSSSSSAASGDKPKGRYWVYQKSKTQKK